MESWTRVIVEWVNCLGIAEPSIQDLQDLRNGAFYEKLVAQLSRGNEDTPSPTKITTNMGIVQQELVSKFIEAEYPEFASSSDECDGAIPNELYTASLLLTQCSQRAAFHRPMCSSLKHETQISIKKFLELVLPYGKSLTREVIAVAITELGDATPGVPPSTPKPSRPLREFFNSPAARSAQSQRFMNDRNRELRRLRAQLETEQFEKTDLIEDIRTQEERIKNLQIKLDEKSRELRALRNERLAPATPQSSCKKKRPSDSEERYRREVEQLENANSSLQSEIERLQDEREELTRRLVSKDRLHEALRKKFDQTEKSAEALAIQLEIKNNELLDMRMNNEELREHIREIQRSSIGEQSFEMEAAISRARSPVLLNSSEALSSIVDIQLQETREESAQLRAQLDSLAEKLVTLQRELEESKRQTDFFRDQTAEIGTLRMDLRDLETRLVESEARAGDLEEKNLGLKENVARIVADLEDKEELLASEKKHREALETNLSAANSRIREFEICRENDKVRINELETIITGVKIECEGLRDLLAEREEKLSRVCEDRKILESNLQDGLRRLKESEIRTDGERSKVAALEEMLDRAKGEHDELENLMKSREEMLSRVNDDKKVLEYDLMEAKQKLGISEASLESEISKVAELKSTVASIKEEWTDVHNLLKSTEEKLAESTKDKKLLETSLEEANKKLEISKDSLENEKSKVTELKSIVESIKEESANLQSLLKSSEKKLAELTEDYKLLESNLVESVKRFEKSEASLENERSKVTELKSTVESFNKESLNLQNLLKSAEEKLAESTKDNKLLETNLEEANKKLEISKDCLENEKSKVTELKSIVESIKEESSNLQSLLKSSEKKLGELTEDNKLLESNLEESVKRFEKSEACLENERSKVTALKSTVESINKESLNLQTLLKSVKEKLAELTEVKKSLELDLDETKKRFEKSEASLATETSKVAELKFAIAESSRESENVRNQLSSTVMQLSTAIETSQALESDLEATRKKLSASELNSKNQQLRVTELESELSRIRGEFDDLENALRSKEALLSREKSRIADLESALSEGKRDAEDLRMTLQELKTALENERAGTAQLSDIVSRSRETSKNLESLLKSKEEYLEKSLQRESSLESELESSRSRIQELELSLSSESSRVAKLEMELSRSTEISDEYKAALSSTQSLLADAESGKNLLQSELERAREEILDRDAKISNLEKNFGDLEEKNTTVLQEKAKIEECCRQAEEKVSRLELEISEARVRIEELEESTSKEMETSKNLRSELGAQKIETDALRLRLEETESREVESAARLESAEKRIAELTELGEEIESQLSRESEQFSEIVAEKNIVEEKLSSQARSLVDARERIAKLEKELEKSAEDRIAEMTKLGEEIESQLSRESEKFSEIVAEKNIVEEKLSSQARSLEDANERIAKLAKELEESEKKLRSQNSDNLVSRKKLSELEEIKTRLEHKLSEEQSESAFILSERNALEKELSSQLRSSANTNEKLRKTEEKLEEAEKNLRNQSDLTAGLQREKLELIERRSSLEKELVEERRKSSAIESEKNALEEKLSCHMKSSAQLQDLITKTSSDLDESRKKLDDQLVINELLEKEKLCQERHKEKLEMELADSREKLSALQSEKEMLEVETSLYGRSNEDLGAKIVTLKAQLEAESKALREERETSAALKKKQEELKSLVEKMKSQLADERDHLALVEGCKTSLEKEVSSLESSRADMVEEMSSLHEELESSRKELRSLAERNEDLERKALEANSRIEILRDFELRSSQLSEDLASSREECESLRSRLVDLSAESDRQADEITKTKRLLQEVERERDLLSEKLRESAKSSKEGLSSLEERLLATESSLAEARLHERSKDEALAVLRAKLEKLSEDKTESELRMKEVIANLQEVRKTQDGVLRAQEKALAENSRELEKASKQLVSLKTSLEASAGELDQERSKTQQLQTESSRLKEAVERKSKLVRELQETLENERKSVVEWTERSGVLNKSLEDIARVSMSLKRRMKELWDAVCRACPELEPRERPQLDERLETATIAGLVESFVDDARTIGSAFARLGESNESLRKGMEEMSEASRSLRLELSGLWDSVRKACPELARPKVESTCLEDAPEGASSTSWTTGISAIESFAEDARTIGKAISILSEANETLKEHLDGEKRTAKIAASEAERKSLEVDERINKMESELEKRDRYVSLLVGRSKDLQALLSSVISGRDEVDRELGALTARWRGLAEKARSVLTVGSSACDELKHLRIKRTEVEESLSDVSARRARGLKPLLKALCRIFLWSEAKLQRALVPTLVKEELSTESELSEEQELLRTDIGDNEKVHEELGELSEKIDKFSSLLESYETSLRDGVIKREVTNEEKLQAQVEKISKERRDIKDKLDAVRARNAKLEKNMDELRNENKKLKSEAPSATSTDITEVEKLERLTEKLEKEILRLRDENEELAKRKSGDVDDEARMKEVHKEYGVKLEKIKQKMKTAYNEQIAKLNQEQDKAMKEKLETLRGQMEQQCRKYTEDIAKYKAHISDLSSRYWDVGEKLLAETQEKQAALQQLQQLKGQQQGVIAEANQHISFQDKAVSQSRQKTASLDRRDFGVDRTTRESTARQGYRAVEVIEEETTTFSTRRHSVKSIQAMGNAFNAEDEEGEVFDSVYLADLKEGRCAPAGPDYDRLSELRKRNSMFRPHLRSSYAVETHVQPITLNEDDIKNGVTGDDVFNDSLSQSLLPGQKPKKKDRTQTSYKRPGPPTPSKNGGRLSLQGNELKSPGSRILRERNVERRTTATPRGLKNLFGTSISKRQDENVTGTPKARRLSNIFRKQRTERN